MINDKQELQLIVDFVEGDLLYGLEKHARDKYRPALESKIIQQRAQENPEHNEKKIYLTIDDIHADVMPQVFWGSEYDIAISPLKTPTRMRMRDFLADENVFHPLKAIDNEIAFNSPCSKKLASSCKQALLLHRATIRFCLDGLNMDKVRNPQCASFNSFTSTELRFVAHNWDNPLCNMQQRVVFYEKGAQVPAPWADAVSPTVWLRSFNIEEQNNNRQTNEGSRRRLLDDHENEPLDDEQPRNAAKKLCF